MTMNALAFYVFITLALCELPLMGFLLFVQSLSNQCEKSDNKIRTKAIKEYVKIGDG